MSTYGNQQPPNPGPGQYGSPQPPPGGTTYGGNTYGSPSSGAPYSGGTYGSAPTSGGTYGAAPTSGGTYGSAPTSGGTYGAPPAGAPQYGGAPYGSAPGGAPYGGGPAGGPPPYGSQPPRQGTNGLSIAGLVLSWTGLIGLILSIIGLVQAGKRGQKGKGLAVAGIIISLIVMIGGVVLVAATASKVTKLADPGCTIGKSAVLDNSDKINNPDTIKEGLQATITGLDRAVAQANHSDVRDAMKALRDDYNQMLNAVTTGTPPDSNLTNKITTDGNRVDSLCSIGTK
jgi:soluble cytochrome b562